MAGKRKKIGAETGKSRTTTKLSGLVINLGGIDFVQQEHSVKALVTYEFDRGSPPTEFDPGYESVFELIRIMPSKQLTFVDDSHTMNVRAWAHTNLVPYLTEDCLLSLDKQVEAELTDFARNDY